YIQEALQGLSARANVLLFSARLPFGNAPAQTVRRRLITAMPARQRSTPSRGGRSRKSIGRRRMKEKPRRVVFTRFFDLALFCQNAVSGARRSRAITRSQIPIVPFRHR